MKAEAGISWPERSAPPWSGAWQGVMPTVRRFPRRLRERRFWLIQLLVLTAVSPHYAFEMFEFTGPFAGHELHAVALTLYIVPLLYAALTYNWEGALLTATWLAGISVPSALLWHRADYEWVYIAAQLTLILPLGTLAAWRVDMEAKLRRRAEESSASLALLNEVGESLRHTLEVEEHLPQVLRRLLSGLSLESTWLCLEPESDGDGPVAIVEASEPQQPSPAATARDLHQRLTAQDKAVAGPVFMNDRTVAVSLIGETGTIGSLGMIAAADEVLTAQQVELLTTVAHQVRVAIENARLYRQRQESLRSYAQQVTQAQEEERLKIARDLHDETAQELVHLVRKLEQLRDGSASSRKQPIDDLLGRTRGALQTVRRFSRDLRPSVLDDLGLLAAIEMVVEDANSSLPQGARLQVTGKARRVDAPVELALFRIAQEALRNVEKHARATSATVDLEFNEESVRLSVTDDGLGFSPPKNVSDLASVGKLGLLGMKERAELVGGRFELHSSPGQGTQLVVGVTQNGTRQTKCRPLPIPPA